MPLVRWISNLQPISCEGWIALSSVSVIANAPGSASDALGATALPLTLYVGADGRILGRHYGQRDWSEAAAVRDVKQHLLAK